MVNEEKEEENKGWIETVQSHMPLHAWHGRVTQKSSFGGHSLNPQNNNLLDRASGIQVTAAQAKEETKDG